MHVEHLGDHLAIRSDDVSQIPPHQRAPRLAPQADLVQRAVLQQGLVKLLGLGRHLAILVLGQIVGQLTRKGLLIPCKALGDLGAEELEAVREEGTIIVRPKSAGADERARVRQALQAAGMLYEPEWEPPTPVSPGERAHLAQKLGQAGPLSEIIIADRGDVVVRTV